MRGSRALCATLPASHQMGPTARTATTSRGATAPLLAVLILKQEVQRWGTEWDQPGRPLCRCTEAVSCIGRTPGAALRSSSA